MSNVPTDVSEHDAIAKTVQHYIDGAKRGGKHDRDSSNEYLWLHNQSTSFSCAG